MSIYKGNKLVAGGSIDTHDPDWSQAVQLDVLDIYRNGYNAPSNGIIVGYFSCGPKTTADIKINNILVARTSAPPEASSMTGNVQCPVNKGDHITLEVNSSVAGNLHFVPYKRQ